jgi:hypothetical protein
MLIDIYDIVGNPGGNCVMYIMPGRNPKDFHPEWEYKKIESCEIDPQGGGFARQILSDIDSGNFYLSREPLSGKVKVEE